MEGTPQPLPGIYSYRKRYARSVRSELLLLCQALPHIRGERSSLVLALPSDEVDELKSFFCSTCLTEGEELAG